MEKMLMKISKENYLLLNAVAEFHMKFSEYVREQDSDLFFRAVDYAKTYTNVEGMQFDYWHDDNKKFLSELLAVLETKSISFDKFVAKVGNIEDAKEAWMKKNKTTSDDMLGMKNYLENFKRHANELDYDSFDVDDWRNFVNVCKYIKDDSKFIEMIENLILKYFNENSDLYKEFKNEN
jgi:hypothetical protein